MSAKENLLFLVAFRLMAIINEPIDVGIEIDHKHTYL
jgi:hypothetical protein